MKKNRRAQMPLVGCHIPQAWRDAIKAKIDASDNLTITEIIQAGIFAQILPWLPEDSPQDYITSLAYFQGSNAGDASDSNVPPPESVPDAAELGLSLPDTASETAKTDPADPYDTGELANPTISQTDSPIEQQTDVADACTDNDCRRDSSQSLPPDATELPPPESISDPGENSEPVQSANVTEPELIAEVVSQTPEAVDDAAVNPDSVTSSEPSAEIATEADREPDQPQTVDGSVIAPGPDEIQASAAESDATSGIYG